MASTTRPKSDTSVEVDAARTYLRALLMQVPFPVLVVSGPDHVLSLTNGPYLELIGRSQDDVLGKPVREALPELANEGYFELLDRVYATGEPFVGREMRGRLARRKGGELETVYFDFVYSPYRDAEGRIAGITGAAFDVTEFVRARKEREKLLAAARAGEEQFRTLADTMPVLAWYAEPDGHVSWYNRRWLDYTGLSLPEHQGWEWQRAHDPRDLPRVLDKWRRALERGEAWEDQYRLRRHDGVFRWFLSRAAPLRDSAGRIVRWFGTSVDIDDQKRAEEARAFLARASETFASSLDYEQTLRKVAELAVPHVADWCSVELIADDPSEPVSVGLAHVDPEKVSLVRELRRRYPTDPEAPVGKVLGTGRSAVYEEVTDALLQAVAKDAEHLDLLRSLCIRSAMIVPIKNGGSTLGAISFAAAESERRYGPTDLALAEELARRAAIAIENARVLARARAAEARNRFLAEATETLASSLDYNQTLERIVHLSVRATADLASLYWLEPDGSVRLSAIAAADPRHEAVARELDALLPLHVEQHDRALIRSMRSGKAELIEDIPAGTRETWSPTPRAGELLAELAFRSYMAVPLLVRGRALGALALTTNARGRRLGPDDLALAEELARRAALAVENARLYREAQEASRLKDEFLATVSHELRTPLMAILGWTHLLRTGRASDVARAAETIERNAQAQARIVEDVLDTSRIITGKLQLKLARVSLREVVRAAIDTVRPAAEAKSIELVTSVDFGVGDTLGDAERLQQVTWNLLANAIKFTPAGGRVEARLEREGAFARLTVVDSGQGIHPDFLPHVFERFRQGDSTMTRAHGGLGLGLAIVRHLVELHGGYVSADSPGEGQGATFTVRLPLQATLSEGDAAAGHRAPPSGKQPTLRGVRLLVVDDEADTRELLAVLLEQLGADVTTAPSVGAALESLEHQVPDVLVSDLGMPEEDGYTLIRRVRELGVERGFWFPAVALTAYAQTRDKNRALSAGYQVHLSKPIEPAALVATVAELAGRTSEP